jgi:hypothetical protein
VAAVKPWQILLLLCTCVGATGLIAGAVLLFTRRRRRDQ